jgi:hypothetical protein
MQKTAVRVLFQDNGRPENAAFVQQLWAFASAGRIQIDESALS